MLDLMSVVARFQRERRLRGVFHLGWERYNAANSTSFLAKDVRLG